MQAIILSIGDELVLGQTVDTNSAWLSQQLARIGCAVAAHVTVADDQKEIERAILDASHRCDWLIISGGLGPTEDDLTRQALAAVLNEPLELQQEWVDQLRTFFKARGRMMPESNRIQAMIPRGAKPIHNSAGTALGIDATLSRGAPDAGICRIMVVPGVPKEMKRMFEAHLLPAMRAAGGGAVILSRTLHTFGLGESHVAERLGTLMRRDRNPSVGTTVSGGIVSLRVNARFASAEEAQRELEATSDACRNALGQLIFGQDDQTLPDVVGGLLKEKGASVCTAESCTGGLVAKMLTDIPGSSRYFSYGWVTYANAAKHQLLGVSNDLLDRHGAVSEPVVLAMALGAQERAGTTHALALSGIAGPDGGSEGKPVGTTWIALADAESVAARRFVFPGDREMIRDRAAKTALAWLRFKLLGIAPMF
jgi:nicotinamide-nucleotide amidase